MAEPLNIALIGTRFMGRVHSHAWRSVNAFFDLPRRVVLRTVCGRDASTTRAFAERWGWEAATDDWRAAIGATEVDLVDVAAPNHLHAAPAIAALEAGKHVACEKPLAGTLAEARAMRDAAREAGARGLRTFVWFNYRRCPAVALAHELIRSGRLGRLYHVRCTYLQDWGGPETPALWRFDADQAGSGAHGDLNAHLVDLARFLTGDEITEVSGALEETFVPERDAVDDRGRRTGGRNRTTVDDCVLFLARFRGGAVGSFEATRLATGNRNRNAFEINGEHGSVRFDFERMNELSWWDHTQPVALRGWTRIHCTQPDDHPFAGAWWPPGHGLGYEHAFVNQCADIVQAAAGGEPPIVPMPDFADAYDTQRILHAALVAARERRAVTIDESEA